MMPQQTGPTAGSDCRAERGAHCPGHKDESCIVEETIGTVLTTLDVDVVLERTARLLRRHFGRTRLAVTRVDRDHPDQGQVLLVDDPQQRPPAPARGTRFVLEGTAAGLAISSGQKQIFDGLDPERPRVAEERTLPALGYGALVSLPLVAEGMVLGTLDIAHPPRCGLLDHCVLVAERVAQLIAIALRNGLLMDEVRRLNRLLEDENSYLRDEIERERGAGGYVAESPQMREVLERVRLAAPSQTTVLIRGETGTGKEGLALLVHQLSGRKQAPFVVVNLAAIPEGLIESELFGHEKGAFTGATRRKIGRFEQASGGTLFLDEVGDAPLPVQVKLLRVLQEQRIDRLGGERPISVDVRVVAATNRPLEQMIAQGTFRSDLYYRLSAFPLHLPALRRRPGDLRPLVQHLVAKHAARMHRRPPQIPERTFADLAAHEWPGNVRELENFLERALILCPGAELRLRETPAPRRSATAVAGSPVGAEASTGVTLGHAPRSFDEQVRAVLERALAETGGKIYGDDGAAALLGLRPTTLQGKLRKHGLR